MLAFTLHILSCLNRTNGVIQNFGGLYKDLTSLHTYLSGVFEGTFMPPIGSSISTKKPGDIKTNDSLHNAEVYALN